MKSIFIKDDETVEVDIFFVKNENGDMFLGNKKDALLKQEGVAKDSLEEHKVTFKYPNHGDMNDILSKSIQMGIGGLTIDPIAARVNRLTVLLKDWTFVDDDGKKLPINVTNINKLHSSVADFILTEFELKTGIE